MSAAGTTAPEETVRRRLGFTMAEILVALAIVAMVAAVVIPTFTAQLGKADPQRVGNDAFSIRGAVEQFVNDVGQYPSNINQLTTRMTANNASWVSAIYGQYSVGERDKWRGPYLTKDASAVLSTGFDATFNTVLNVDSLGTSGLAEASSNTRFLTLCLALDSAGAARIDAMFDDSNLSTGLFRWTLGTASTSDTLKFLLVPIQ
jgi:prepilin-type N-terminal cleavage/methylation domain-containing protein